jgi:hypothetical protein
MPLFSAQSVSYLHQINLCRVLRIESRQGAQMKSNKTMVYRTTNTWFRNVKVKYDARRIMNCELGSLWLVEMHFLEEVRIRTDAKSQRTEEGYW